MPGFDKTGPLGQGPLTGGGFGRCRPGADDDSLMRDDTRWGIGRGGRPRGGGRGRCFGGGRGGGNYSAQGRPWIGRSAPPPADNVWDERVAQLLRENEELRAQIAALKPREDQ
jgi:hypothetical protein